VASYPAGASFTARTLRDHELVLLLTGGAVWTCDGTATELVPGGVLLARPGSRDHYRWHPTATSRHAYVHFEVTGPGPLPPVLRHQPPTGVVGHLFRYLVWLDARADPASAALAEATFGLLLDAVLTGLTPEQAQPDDLPATLRRAVDHVRARWADGVLRPVSQAELAAAAGLSVGAFSRLFGRHLGVPPARAVEGVRLARAAALARTGAPLRQVAQVCGFADAYHLSHRFRAVHGFAPVAVRDGRAVSAPDGVRRLEQLLLDVGD
jgi:AraC-like DNA-binding protein